MNSPADGRTRAEGTFGLLLPTDRGLGSKLSLMPVVLLTLVAAGTALLQAACHSASDPDPKPDTQQGEVADHPKLQTTEEVSSLTPLASVTKVTFSEKEFRPTGLSGELSVGIGLDWQVHLVNVITGDRRRLTGGLDRKREAVISDSHVAWTSQNRFREVLSNLPIVRRSYHVFVMAIETGLTTRVTGGTAMRGNLLIDGRRLVWEESRSMVGDRYTEYDVYVYDIDLDEIIPVAVAPGSQRRPAIHGDRVTWVDGRNCREVLEDGVESSPCPGDLWDIRIYDFATGEGRPVAKSTASAHHPPDIHGDHIVWRSHGGRYNENTTLNLHALTDGRTRTIASFDHGNIGRPMVSDHYVAWTVREPCDVVWIPPRDMGTGAFAYSIANGTTRQLSDHPEPDVLLDNKAVVVHEGCWFPGPVHSFFLD